jgi:hypothetical protein
MELDPATGRIANFQVRVLGDKPYALFQHGKTPLAKDDLDDIYLEFANLKNDTDIIAFMEKYGCIFGTLGLNRQTEEVIEQIEEWRTAVTVLRQALNIKAVLDGRLGIAALGESIFTFSVKGAMGFRLFSVLSITVVKSGLYAQSLKLSVEDSAYTQEDGLHYSESWSHCDSWGSLCESCGACESYIAHARITTPDYISPDEDSACIEVLALERDSAPPGYVAYALSSILETLVSAHVHASSLRFRQGYYNHYFNLFLAYIWHKFAEDYQGKRIGICKECKHIMECSNERRHKKEYCSKTCRDRARNRRNAKARKLAAVLIHDPVQL